MAPVYDLTVAHDHEFIAGSLLVANCLVWLEEAAAMRYLGDALHHTAFGLRIGPTPHFVASTTPKPRKELRALLANPLTMVTRGRTAEAHHLDQGVRDELFKAYAGTRLGRQELDGDLLDDVEGALWRYDHISAGRVTPKEAPDYTRVVVAMDPAVSVTETSDETGLVAAGMGTDRHVYVLADRSKKMAGTDAARAAWLLWLEVNADVLVYEDNQGKRWVADVLRQVWSQMQGEGLLPPGNAPLEGVTAMVGKRLRAEPMATLYEPPMEAHHVGVFQELEDQMTTWVPETGGSPDRLDALVHALTYLAGRAAIAQVASPVGLSRLAIAGAGRIGSGIGGKPMRSPSTRPVGRRRR